MSSLVLLALPLFSLNGCQRNDNSILDSVGQPPTLVQVFISPSSINTDSISVGSSRKPDDLLPLTVIVSAQANSSPENPLKAVRFSVRTPDAQETVSNGFLLDDGAGADQTKEDGIYSSKASFQIRRTEIGLFQVEVTAEARNGSLSNTVITPLSIFRGNSPPILSDLQAPDTVRLGAETQPLTLRVKATDPDGSADIVRVIFNSFKPDGSASGSNPFQMFDDGLADHGDVTSGDSIYSLIIQLPANTPTGTYRFEFHAFDQLNTESNVIIHRITVKQ